MSYRESHGALVKMPVPHRLHWAIEPWRSSWNWLRAMGGRKWRHRYPRRGRRLNGLPVTPKRQPVPLVLMAGGQVLTSVITGEKPLV